MLVVVVVDDKSREANSSDSTNKGPYYYLAGAIFNIQICNQIKTWLHNLTPKNTIWCFYLSFSRWLSSNETRSRLISQTVSLEHLWLSALLKGTMLIERDLTGTIEFLGHVTWDWTSNQVAAQIINY